jgi:cytidine deaminase
MIDKQLIIPYKQYDSMAELPAEDQELAAKALEATNYSYAPYSSFHVGAAARLSNGEIVNAGNQENSAFPSGLCAERVTCFYAHSHFPKERIVALAITAVQNGVQCELPTYPCGACRQVLIDFEQEKGDIRVILAGTKRTEVFDRVRCLLPFEFDNWDGIKR